MIQRCRRTWPPAGEFTAATTEKLRLEEKQREARKARKAAGQEYTPLWFDLVRPGEKALVCGAEQKGGRAALAPCPCPVRPQPHRQQRTHQRHLCLWGASQAQGACLSCTASQPASWLPCLPATPAAAAAAGWLHSSPSSPPPCFGGCALTCPAGCRRRRGVLEVQRALLAVQAAEGLAGLPRHLLSAAAAAVMWSQISRLVQPLLAAIELQLPASACWMLIE
jgi:hypothetical protein